MVYLIHLATPYKHARHYIGYTKRDSTLQDRFNHHVNGSGSAFLRAVSKAGISFEIVRTWPGEDGNFERKLKKWKKSSQLCPICSPAAKNKLDEQS